MARHTEAMNNPNQEFMHKEASSIDLGLTSAQEERAMDLHERLTVFDCLVEVTWYDNFLDMLDKGHLGMGGGGSITIGAAGMEDWRGKGQEVVARSENWWTKDSLIKDIGFMRAMEKQHKDRMMLCYNVADLRKAKAEKKMGFMLNTQNSNYVGQDIDNVDILYNLGLRITQLSYNNQNFVASGQTEKRDVGVSLFGESVIGRMNEVGMLVDTGHCSSQTLIDACNYSEAPVFCSHAGMRSHTPKVNRSHTDEALKLLADKGGVLGFVGQPGPVSGSDRCDVRDYAKALRKAVNLMGREHVGFGLDHYQAASLETILTAPEWTAELAASALGASGSDDFIDPSADGHLGLENNSGYPNMTRAMVAEGFTDDEIIKIMGENALRLIGEVIG